MENDGIKIFFKHVYYIYKFLKFLCCQEVALIQILVNNFKGTGGLYIKSKWYFFHADRLLSLFLLSSEVGFLPLVWACVQDIFLKQHISGIYIFCEF